MSVLLVELPEGLATYVSTPHWLIAKEGAILQVSINRRCWCSPCEICAEGSMLEVGESFQFFVGAFWLGYLDAWPVVCVCVLCAQGCIIKQD